MTLSGEQRYSIRFAFWASPGGAMVVVVVMEMLVLFYGTNIALKIPKNPQTYQKWLEKAQNGSQWPQNEEKEKNSGESGLTDIPPYRLIQ